MTEKSAVKDRSSNDGEKTKSNDKKMPKLSTKIVIRRLPSTMNESSFLESVSPLPEFTDFYFVEADKSLEPYAFSRAYINFQNPEDVYIFQEKFDGYIFIDNKGFEYPAIVEFAPYQRIPYKNQDSSKKKPDPKVGTIEKDPDYIKFLEDYEDDKSQTHVTMNQRLEEIEAKEKEKASEGLTPLIQFIKEKREEKFRLRQEKREQRKKKEEERIKMREESKKKRDDDRGGKNSKEFKEEGKVKDDNKKFSRKERNKEKDRSKEKEFDKEKDSRDDEFKDESKKSRPKKDFKKGGRDEKNFRNKNRENKETSNDKDEQNFDNKKPQRGKDKSQKPRNFNKSEKPQFSKFKSEQPREETDNKPEKSKPLESSEKGTNKPKRYSDRRKVEQSKRNDFRNEEDIKPNFEKLSINETKSDKSENSLKKDQRQRRENNERKERLKNKERPTLEIYRPGMGRYSSRNTKKETDN